MIFNQFCFLVSLWACSTTPIVALSSGAARLDAPQPPLEVDCAIIGGGPAGLAAAIAISKSSPSSSIAIFERDQFQPKGASIQISKPGWESIAQLDPALLDKLKETSVPVTAVELKPFDSPKSSKPKKSFANISIQVVSFIFRLLRRAVTHTHLWHDVRMVLADQAKHLYSYSEGTPSDLIYTNCSLKRIKVLNDDVQDDNANDGQHGSRFELVLDANNHERTVKAKFLFACDGTKSRTRSLLPKEPDILLAENKSVWRGTARNISTFGKATFYKDDENGGRSALIFPAGRDAGSSWTVISEAEDGKSETDQEARDRVLRIVKDCDEILKRAIDDSPIIIENKLQVRNFDLPWGSAYDGLIFIGDSAHPVRPTGEGTALAFEDARVLGEMIAEHGLSVKVLRAYEDERYEPVKIISEKVRASAQGFYKNSKKTV